jgi:hypothetical protein
MLPVEPARCCEAGTGARRRNGKFQIAGRNGFQFFPFSPRQFMQERAMPFSTKSYLAGVGTVVAALTIGFSGGFFLAPSTEHVEQNRLQRVTSTASAAITPLAEARPIELVAAPAPATQQPARTETIPVMARAVDPAPAPIAARTADPARAASDDAAAKPEITYKMQAAEAKAERKRAREERRAERRKQREIELAAFAVKRMVRDRDPQQLADRTESPRLGFFGADW